MIIVDTKSGNKLVVAFQHLTNTTNNVPVTVAAVYNIDPSELAAWITRNKDTKYIAERDNIIGVGFARCSIKDNFNKSTGRKLALRRALEIACNANDIDRLPYDTRKSIWDTYFKSCKRV